VENNLKDTSENEFEDTMKYVDNHMSTEQIDSVTPLDLLSSTNYTTKEVRDSRFTTCKDCDRLFKPTRTCKECGCFMALKTWLKDASCPLGKW
jgi:protein-arginine kinase activator protein McsA